jgi:hypothetical protein
MAKPGGHSRRYPCRAKPDVRRDLGIAGGVLGLEAGLPKDGTHCPLDPLGNPNRKPRYRGFAPSRLL